ncbi:MAG: nuclear transport factor 2 family protein [Verrucomicrobiales bacterium]|nr:nuclear transport factor 2 family protein [Verrucomicrobiales bacterium]
MSPLTRYITGLKTHDIPLIASTLADDLRFVTPARSMTKPETLEFLTALYRAFPDWHYDHDPPTLQPDGSIAVTWRQGGSHTATLEFPGFDPVPATGKTVTIPPHPFFYHIDETHLTEIRPDPIPGGAPRGIFQQIGVKLPPL